MSPEKPARRWLRNWCEAVLRLSMFQSERDYADQCATRPQLSDDQFLATYYPSSEVRPDVPLRVRRVMREQLGFDKVIPSDCPCDILQDIDVQHILAEIGEEFGISLAAHELPTNDWSMGAMINLANSKLR